MAQPMRRACFRVLKRGLACVRVVCALTNTDGVSLFFDSIVAGQGNFRQRKAENMNTTHDKPK